MKTRIVKRKRGYLVQEKILFFFWTCAICDYSPLDVTNIYFDSYEKADKARKRIDNGEILGRISPA
jgi:hypothetical protein